MAWQLSIKFMALEINKLPQAISGVMNAIDEGLAQAGAGGFGFGYIDSVRPPEKVVFSADAIVGVNSLDRIQTIVEEPFVRTIVASNIIERVSYNGDEASVPLPPAPSFNTTIETTSKKTKHIKTREDQAIGFVFEYPGPKSS